ncbi:MAG: hydroxymethylglutaryl-CoA synthase [Actinophytocola sp.]|uniref:OB-fold domain-containing protein n=1 Tax=Actinophytocola sp. TaxID=1872138 RepID=UPI0013218AC5|nr:OB-fold domain-containing protein [Actinophytocola sp.]MPZ83198.1 hydroxymethylglutaryl-CoA synthase [Actinophytocola sp.]
MTARLLAYASYRPAHELSRAAIGAALGMAQVGAGVRAVAGFDEDPITMAVGAIRRLPPAARRTDWLYFATSSPVFLDKTNAAFVQAAVGGSQEALTLDVCGLSSGFAALACASATGGTAVLSDLHTGRPGSTAESEGGDGAAAFLFGDGDTAVADVVAICSRSLDLMDRWRVPGQRFAHVAEERLIASVHGAAVDDVVAEVTGAAGLDGLPVRTVVAAPDRRLAATISARWGRDSAVQTWHRDHVGYCGAADVGQLTASALDRSAAGDTILVISAASSVGAMLLRVLRDGHPANAEGSGRRGRPVSYPDFLAWRGWLDREPPRRPDHAAPFPAAFHRNRDWKFALTGSRCQACGAVWLPPQRMCGSCHALDSVVPHPVADCPARLVALTTDGITGSLAPPAMAGVVDFDGGGRMSASLTDTSPGELEPGDPVQMVFRRTWADHGAPDYFWKGRPLPGGGR